MKRCPKCEFSFADFHVLCDFDGTELVDDPATMSLSPAVAALAASQSHFPRLLKSPVFLTASALVGLGSSALLIGYYDSPTEPASISETRAIQDSIVGVSPLIQPLTQSATQIETSPLSVRPPEINKLRAAEDSASKTHRLAAVSRPPDRLTASASVRNQQKRTEVARLKSSARQKESAGQRESGELAEQKEPKVSALLKTAWHILKKPFKL